MPIAFIYVKKENVLIFELHVIATKYNKNLRTFQPNP